MAQNVEDKQERANHVGDIARPSSQRAKLCIRCQSLQLSVEKFVIGRPSPHVSQTSASKFALSSSTSPLDFGSLADIASRGEHGCPLCTLIVYSVAPDGDITTGKFGPLSKLPHVHCLVSWQLDGRRTKASDKGRSQSVRAFTRRIHLAWNNEQLQDAYLVFVAREPYLVTQSDAEKVWGSKQLFMGRRIGDTGSIQAQMRSWLDLCRDRHKNASCVRDQGDMQTKARFFDMVSHSYFGVVDVQNMHLVSLPYGRDDHAPFVALSYVWGRAPTYRAENNNIRLLRTHGGIETVEKELPRVIRDAFDLTRRLGLQYIWIDSLCIVQDSPRSWKLNADNMDIIYGSAELTICAADGDHANIGLLAMKQRTNDQRMAKCASGVRLAVTRPPEQYIKRSKWNTRAWTFQERLLSRRCLIFTAGHVYFQCRSTGMSEDIYADRAGAGWSIDLADAPMQMFRQLPQRAFWVYSKVLELYTSRDLTKSEDILAALSGIRNLLVQTMNAPFIFGLPSSHFDLALLWQHFTPVTRRQTPNKSHADHPSWCWSGWEGAAARYNPDMIGECFASVRDWLRSHTWIEWHIRDGCGDLRPLYDDPGWDEDLSEEAKWRGYQSPRLRFLHKRAAGVDRHQFAHDSGASNDGFNEDEQSVVSGDERRRSTRHPPSRSNRSMSVASSQQGNYGNYQRAPNQHRDRTVVNHTSRKPENNARDHYAEYGPSRVPEMAPMNRGLNGNPAHMLNPTSVYPQATVWQEDDEWYSSNKQQNPAMPYTTVNPAQNTLGQYANMSSIPPQFPLQAAVQPVGMDPYDQNAYGQTQHMPPYGHNAYGQIANIEHRPRRSPELKRSPPIRRSTHRGPQHDLRQSYAESRQGRDVQDPDAFYRDQHEAGNDNKADPKFFITLRDYPYHVVMAEFSRRPETLEYPLMPILQFWTHHTLLYIQSTNRRVLDDQGLARCHIADSNGDWCGSILLDQSWINSSRSAGHEFIALSGAKSFTKEECENWTYYIPKEREQSESDWDLYFVMLIERKQEKWERVGLGKVFKEAFRGSTWKEIMLA